MTFFGDNQETSLSDKRKELIKHLEETNLDDFVPYIFGLIEKQDKEFIKKLKEEIEPLRYGIKVPNANRLKEKINKLAGDKLNGK